MKKLIYFLGLTIALIIVIQGCKKDDPVNQKLDQEFNSKTVIIENNDNYTTIFAGQDTDAGSISLVDIDTDGDGDPDALEVTYATTGNWVLQEIHYAIGKSQDDIPMTRKGNLIPGQFPYKFDNLGDVYSYSFNVPFTDFNFTCGDGALYAAAHCVVGIPDGAGGYTQTETGWGFGSNQPGKSWGMIFSLEIVCDDYPGGDGTTETAFAYGCEMATCFLNIDEDGDNDGDFSRWGWSNGPLTEYGTYYFDIYAGAGQCNRDNGTLVGELIVEYDGSTAEVTYTTCGDYTMDETHLYVGCDILPSKNGEFTIAPGQFPYKHSDLSEGAQTDSYTIENLSCDDGIYVVAHAVVMGDYDEGDCGDDGCDFVPTCTPEWTWNDFSSLPGYYSGSENITLCDGKTMTIDIANITGANTIQFDGGTVADPFFTEEHSIYTNIDDIDYKRFRTRAASAEGNFNNAAPSSYTMTWTFGTPLDHTNFFVVGQLLQGNVATITAYDPDMTTVVNSSLLFEQLSAVKSTYTFTEPLSWTASSGELKKSSTTGSNSKYGFFSISEGTQIGEIVITLNDDGTRGATADEVNYGVGCYVCPQ